MDERVKGAEEKKEEVKGGAPAKGAPPAKAAPAKAAAPVKGGAIAPPEGGLEVS